METRMPVISVNKHQSMSQAVKNSLYIRGHAWQVSAIWTSDNQMHRMFSTSRSVLTPSPTKEDVLAMLEKTNG